MNDANIVNFLTVCVKSVFSFRMSQLETKFVKAIAAIEQVKKLVWEASAQDEDRPMTSKEAEEVSAHIQYVENTLRAWYKKLQK